MNRGQYNSPKHTTSWPAGKFGPAKELPLLRGPHASRMGFPSLGSLGQALDVWSFPESYPQFRGTFILKVRFRGNRLTCAQPHSHSGRKHSLLLLPHPCNRAASQPSPRLIQGVPLSHTHVSEFLTDFESTEFSAFSMGTFIY